MHEGDQPDQSQIISPPTRWRSRLGKLFNRAGDGGVEETTPPVEPLGRTDQASNLISVPDAEVDNPPVEQPTVSSIGIPAIEASQPSEQFDFRKCEIPPELMQAIKLVSASHQYLQEAFSTLDVLPLEQVVGVCTRFVAESADVGNMSSGLAYNMFGKVNERLRAMRSGREPLELTPVQLQSFQELFNQVQAKLPEIRRSQHAGRETSIRSSLHSLVNQNRELSVLAAPLFGDLLLGANSGQPLQEAFSTLDVLPLEQVVGVCTRFVAESADVGNMSSGLAYNMFGKVNERLRAMRSGREPLELTPVQLQSFQELFNQVQAKLPEIRRSQHAGRETSIRSSLHSLVNQNRELSVLAAPLFGDLLLGANSGQPLQEAFSTLDVLPLEQVVGVCTRFVAESADVGNMSSGLAYNMFGKVNERLRAMRSGREPLELTPVQLQSFQELFNQVQAKLPEIRRSQHAGRETSIRSSLHSLVNQNRELSVLAAPLFGDLLLGANSGQPLQEAFSTLDVLPLEQVVGVCTRFVAESADVGNMSSGLAYNMFGKVNERLRAMRSGREPLELTPVQLQSFQELFNQVQAKLPEIRRSQHAGRETSIRSSLHSLVNQNRELSVLAAPLFGDLLLGANSGQPLQEAFSTLDVLPLEQVVGVCTRFVAESADVGNMSSGLAYNMFGKVNERLRAMRSGREPLELTPVQLQSFQELFNQVQAKLPEIRRSQHAGRETSIRSSLHSLVNQNPEIRNLASELLEKIGKEVNEAFIERVSTYVPSTPVAQVNEVIEQGEDNVVEVYNSIGRYSGIKRVLQSLPEDARSEITTKLNTLLARDTMANTRLAVLEKILNAVSADNLQLEDVLLRQNLSLNQIPEILSNSVVTMLIEIMADDSDKYKFQLGVLLSQVTIEKLPESLIAKLKPVIANLELHIRVGYETWWLCGQAEPRLIESIRDRAAVLVDGFMLLKFSGKFSGLCIQTTTLANGQLFIEGNWYSPIGGLRDQIRQEFDSGNAKITVSTGEWAMIRPVANDGTNGFAANEIIEQARTYASSIPDRLPDRIRGQQRREYRLGRDEIHG
jgi:hypothetical protein